MISIIVPYRDRPKMLDSFLYWFKCYYAEQILKVDLEIIISEQADDNFFNRGKLLNIGAIYARGIAYVFHDVDMFPATNYFPYWAGQTPYEEKCVYQLVSSNIQTVDYLGGVTRFRDSAFWEIGGYSNNFFSRAEDNEMMFHLKRKGFTIQNHFQQFKEIPHPRPVLEFDPTLWEKAQKIRNEEYDGVRHCNFELVSIERDSGFITHIKSIL